VLARLSVGKTQERNIFGCPPEATDGFLRFRLPGIPQILASHKAGMGCGAIGNENKPDLRACGNLLGSDAAAAESFVIRMWRKYYG
jgi:hypothetical protein